MKNILIWCMHISQNLMMMTVATNTFAVGDLNFRVCIYPDLPWNVLANGDPAKLTGPITHQWIKLITETETVLSSTSPTRKEISSESYMAPSGETLPEARQPVPLLSMKVTTKTGTWNVRTMYNIWHNQVGPGVESARQKDGGKTSENLEEVSRRGAQTRQPPGIRQKEQLQTESADAVQCPPFVPRGTQWSNY